jgi:hypothetical protein
MVHIHREILDLALAPQAAIHVQKLRALHAQGVRWYVKHVVGDNYHARLRIAQDHLHVLIWPVGIGPRFEFFYSDHVDGWFYATPGYRFFELEETGFGSFIGGIQGGGLLATFASTGARSAPIYSTNLPPGTPPKWATKSIFDIGIPLATQRKDFFYTWGSWQAQRVGEASWYPNNKPDSLLVSCWGTPMGRTSMIGWGDYHWGDIVGSYRPPYDVLYDTPPSLYQADGTVLGVLGPYLGPACWWRRGAMQEVDGRKFFIVGDNKGRLHVYPAKPYWSDPAVYNTLVVVGGLLSPASTAIPFVTVTPSYPSWVTMPSVSTEDVLLWWNWNFNKDGTKAATIALHEEAREGYAFYQDSTIVDPRNVSTWRAYLNKQFRDDPPAVFHTSKKGAKPRVLTPGLVEISITITVTGPEEMDFSVSVSVTKQDYFGTSGRYYQDTGYLYADKRINGADNSLPEDTLVTSELQVYSDDGMWYIRHIPD